MALITTADLEKEVIELAPTALTEGSVLSKLGSPDYVKLGDELKWASIGGAQAVGEGELKLASSYNVKRTEVFKTTLVQMVTVSNRVLNDPRGSEMVRERIMQGVQSLAPSADIVAIHGTDPRTGTAITEAADIAIAPNATQHVWVPTDEDLDIAIHQGFKNYARSTGVALSVPAFAEIASIQTPNGGMFKYFDANIDNVFRLNTLRAAVAPHVGWNGWAADETAFENETLGLVGPFEEVLRRVSGVRIDFFKEYLGGVALGDRNEVGYRIELDLDVAVRYQDRFTNVTSA